MCCADVCEQVVERLPQPVRVAHDDDRALAEGEREEAVGLDGAGRVDRSLGQVVQGDRSSLELPLVVQTRDQQQVLDEDSHPRGLVLDRTHRLGEILRPLARAAAKQLRITPDRCQRRAQLVRDVGEEPPQLVLGRIAFRERSLVLGEHSVQRRRHAPDLAPLGALRDARREVAGRDRVGSHRDSPQRAQAAGEHDRGNDCQNREHHCPDEEVEANERVERA